MSLIDQFLKSGLITKKQANKDHANKKRQEHLLKKDKILQQENQNLKQKEDQEIVIEQEKQRQRDLELNKKRDAMLAQREQIFRARQIINAHAQNDKLAEHSYFFNEKQYIKRVYVTAWQREMLARGMLAIAKPDETMDDFVILPRNFAQSVLSICPEKILVIHSEIEHYDELLFNLEKET